MATSTLDQALYDFLGNALGFNFWLLTIAGMLVFTIMICLIEPIET